MGRTLDVLTRGMSRRAEADLPGPTVLVAIAPSSAPHPEPASSGEQPPADDDTVPHIEVGGKSARPRPKAAGAPAESVTPPNVAALLGPQPSDPPPRPPTPIPTYLPVTLQPVPFAVRQPTGRVPVVAPEVVAYHQPEHAISGQYRALWKEITGSGGAPNPRVIVLASLVPAAGSTTVVLNLAVTAAREPAGKVLVVDAGRDGSVAERLGLAGSPGMWEWLEKPFPLGLALQQSSVPGLFVLPSGVAPPDAASPHSERLVLLADHLRQRFDWVLVDVGAWGEPAGAAWVRRCEAAYLVMRRSDADTPEAGRVHEEVARLGGPLRGYVLTGS